MKGLSALIGTLMFVGTAAQVSAQEVITLSLDDCLSIALSDNPTIIVADMEVKRTDYSRKEVIGQLLPNIDFGGQYSRTLEKQTMYMSGFGGMGSGSGSDGEDSGEETPAVPKMSNGIKVGLDNTMSVGFQASMPLIAPQLWKNLQLSDTQIARNVEAAHKSRQELVKQVKDAYYTLLLAIDSQKAIKESYDMAALTHETYKKQFELGAASDYDVLRTSVAMKNIEPELTQAEIAIRQAQLQLVILMGADNTLKFKPASTLSDYEKTMYEHTLSLDTDISNNADMRLMDIDTKMLHQSLDMQKFAYLPTLALTANYNWTTMNNGSPFKNLRWSPYSTVGLSLSIPIFSGGQRWNRVKSAQVQVDEMRFQRENLERSLLMQVELAYDNIKKNVQQIASSSESVRQAERAYNIMEQSFGIGAASYLNLRDSELALTQSRLAYYQSIFNYLVADSQLELLLGKAPLENYKKK